MKTPHVSRQPKHVTPSATPAVRRSRSCPAWFRPRGRSRCGAIGSIEQWLGTCRGLRRGCVACAGGRRTPRHFAQACGAVRVPRAGAARQPGLPDLRSGSCGGWAERDGDTQHDLRRYRRVRCDLLLPGPAAPIRDAAVSIPASPTGITLDDAFSSPVRLKICGYLAGCDEADFQAVMAYCELTAPSLSKNITALNDKGYLDIRKVASGRYTKTRLSITGTGRAALRSHVRSLQMIADAASAR